MKGTARVIQGLTVVVALLLGTSVAQAAKLPVREMNHILGKKGHSLAHGIVRYAWLRSDLTVTVHDAKVAPALCLESWAAFMPTKGTGAIATGDLVLLASEAPRVLGILGPSRFMVTSMGDHLLNESPRLLYVYFVGRGKPTVLAQTLRKALEATATPLKAPSGSGTEMPAPWIDELRSMIGHPGYYQNKVLSINVRRYGQIKMGDHVLPSGMGVSSRLRFQKLPSGHVAGCGTLVLAPDELGRVIDTLTINHVEITAIDSPILDESPHLFFVHFWIVGGAARIAQAVRAALARTNVADPR